MGNHWRARGREKKVKKKAPPPMRVSLREIDCGKTKAKKKEYRRGRAGYKIGLRRAKTSGFENSPAR